jgi:hypothetical protein
MAYRSYRYYRTTSLRILIDLIFVVIEILIGLRILLKLFGASTQAPFVDWIYQTSQPLVSPFLGIFPSARIEGPFLIEISAIFALIIYLFIHYILDWIVDEISYRLDARNHADEDIIEERRPRRRIR